MGDSKFLGSIYGHGSGYAGAVYDDSNVAPTIMTCGGVTENQ